MESFGPLYAYFVIQAWWPRDIVPTPSSGGTCAKSSDGPAVVSRYCGRRHPDDDDYCPKDGWHIWWSFGEWRIKSEEFLVQIKMSTRGVLDRNSKLCDWPESSFRTNENSWYRWWAKMMKQILSVLPRPSTYLVRYIIIRCMIVNYLTRSHLGFVIEIITLEVLQAPSKALDRLWLGL